MELDVRLLLDGGIWLYFNPSVLATDIAWFRNANYRVHQLDCSTWITLDDFHTDVSRELSFPDFYGRNLDAFNDCMRDIDVPSRGGLLLVLHRFDAFAKQHPKAAWVVLDIIAYHSRVCLLSGLRLLAVVQSGDPKFTLAPVGCIAVRWNPHEWLDSRRVT